MAIDDILKNITIQRIYIQGARSYAAISTIATKYQLLRYRVKTHPIDGGQKYQENDDSKAKKQNILLDAVVA